MIRRKGREIALQILYQKELSNVSIDEVITLYKKFLNINSPEALKFGEELVRGIYENLEFIDSIIRKYTPSWPLERINVTDKNILRIAVYEMFFRPDIPEVVSINEAIEIAKIYGTDDSPSFINGVLDSIYKKEIKAHKNEKT
ncbi:transcription antitermination factor NusB [Thermodesulfobacterium sp.]|jgi:N utilization substance protein B|uniref:transcription antitermination factor NusB n=1 Tax=Thermodesulfobacterium sp. TaxID=1965289 RepID=UPI00257A549C|nr:transcription antitermination factor NusB [Thermodesulfobacterium sp.]MBZ4681811.1 nitrogen utilization protein [Thermodesulfobacterium sp.]MDN5379975.1 transcription antitermination protein NusB [Thermodesulfobacterium sp.]